MSAGDTALLVVDVQEKLVPAIAGHQPVVWNVRRLIDGARILGLPVAATEQYPKGLGGTLPELAQRLGEIPSKLTFSCGGCPQIFEELQERGIHKLLVCGIETHVCVYQTASGLAERGYEVEVAADAVSSRTVSNKLIGLDRMKDAGARLTSVEMALFELLEVAGGDAFKEVIGIVK